MEVGADRFSLAPNPYARLSVVVNGPQALKVFLSYSRVDSDRALLFATELEQWGVQLWFDQDSLHASDDWEGEISRILSTCDVFLALISRSALETPGYFHNEIELALLAVAEREPEFSIVPVRLDGSMPPQPLARFHWLDISDLSEGEPPDFRPLMQSLWRIADRRGRASLMTVPAVPRTAPALQAPASLEGANLRYVAHPTLGSGKGDFKSFDDRYRQRGWQSSDRAMREIQAAGEFLPRLWGDRVRVVSWTDDETVEITAGGSAVTVDRSSVGTRRNCPVAIDFIELGSSCATLVRSEASGRMVLIDAGQDEHVLRYLQWLSDGPRSDVFLDALVITRGTEDHFGGARYLLDAQWLRIGRLFHNGIVRGPGNLKLDHGLWNEGRTHVVPSRSAEDLRRRLDEVGSTPYGDLLDKALRSDRVGDVSMVSRLDRFLPGFDEQDFAVEILGPVETADGFERGPSWAETIADHCVVPRIRIQDRSLLVKPMMHEIGERRLIDADDSDSPVNAGALRSDLAKFCYHSSRNLDEEFPRRVAMSGAIVAAGRRDEAYGVGYNGVIAVGNVVGGRALWVTGAEDNLSYREPNWFAEVRSALDYLDSLSNRVLPVEGLLPRAGSKYIDLLRSFGTFLDARHVVHVRMDNKRALVARRELRGDWNLARFVVRNGRLEIVGDGFRPRRLRRPSR